MNVCRIKLKKQDIIISVFRIMSALFIFRRDLRVDDNIALIEATKKYDMVYPIFIMTPDQLKTNKYKADSSVQFMYESLAELSKNINITFYYGKPEQVIYKILKQNNSIKEVFVNQDYTEYAVKRDMKIQKICEQKNVLFSSHEDYMLHPVNTIKTGSGKYYSVFTPYYNNAKKLKVPQPQKVKHHNFNKLDGVSLDKLATFYKKDENPMIIGGRREALKHLNAADSKQDYKIKRDTLTYNTTHLSAYIKFGCVSIREVYYKIKENEPLVRQLYWHDFYMTVGYNNLNYTSDPVYQPKSKIAWQNQDKFNLWREGKTGFPIVDATMRQLKHEQYCHNRGRLIASGFIKFMFMDWRIAEQHYAQNLRDYDPAINYHNWCWSMSFGAFSTPYFRIMNVYVQGKKHDPQAEYIKRWVPELKDVPAKDIHRWAEVHQNYDVDYPKPCVDYDDQRKKSMDAYKNIYKN